MALNFKNSFTSTLWIALVYGDTGCTPTHFRKQGWWGVTSGQTLNVWNTSLFNVNRHAAFYAEEFKDSGGATWSGPGNNWYKVPDIKFNQCYDDNSNCNQQPNFTLLDFSNFESLLVTLGPAPGQIRTQGSVIID